MAPASALHDGDGRFVGHLYGCGIEDHHSTGQRAWCLRCTAWCYANSPCSGCQVGVDEADGVPVECAYCLALVRPANLSLHEDRCRALGALLARFEEGV